MVEQELLGYPRFQFVQRGDGGATVSIVHADFSSAPGGHDVIQGLLPDLLHKSGLEQGDPASADWTIRFDPSARDDLRPDARAAWESAGALGERYVIQNTSDVGGAVTRLWAENLRGALYAIRSALQLVG